MFWSEVYYYGVDEGVEEYEDLNRNWYVMYISLYVYYGISVVISLEGWVEFVFGEDDECVKDFVEFVEVE